MLGDNSTNLNTVKFFFISFMCLFTNKPKDHLPNLIQ